MGALESMVLPGLVVVILVMTFLSMRVDKRQRQRLAEQTRAEELARAAEQDDTRRRSRHP